MTVPKRESLRTKARKKARNMGVADRRRRDASGQSVFGALLEYLGTSPREMEAKYGTSKSLLYRFMVGKWWSPLPKNRDRLCHWFHAETRRELDMISLEWMVTTKAAVDPAERKAQVRRAIDKQPETAQDRGNVREIGVPPVMLGNEDAAGNGATS